MVVAALAPLMVMLTLRSKSPVALLSSPAPPRTMLYVAAGSAMLLVVPLTQPPMATVVFSVWINPAEADQYIAGSIILDVDMVGTTSDPHFAGRVDVTNAGFLVVDSGARSQDVSKTRSILG